MHNLKLAAISCHRQTAADNLAQAGDIGVHIIEGLAATLRTAEAAHNLITDNQCTVFSCQSANTLKIALLGQHKAHIARSGLHDNSGDFFATFSKNLFQCGQIVEGHSDGGGSNCLGHTRAIRHAKGGSTTASLYQQTVMVAMIAAYELHDAVTTGVSASQAQSTHGSFSAAVNHTHLIHGRNQAAH